MKRNVFRIFRRKVSDIQSHCVHVSLLTSFYCFQLQLPEKQLIVCWWQQWWWWWLFSCVCVIALLLVQKLWQILRKLCSSEASAYPSVQLVFSLPFSLVNLPLTRLSSQSSAYPSLQLIFRLPFSLVSLPLTRLFKQKLWFTLRKLCFQRVFSSPFFSYRSFDSWCVLVCLLLTFLFM